MQKRGWNPSVRIERVLTDYSDYLREISPEKRGELNKLVTDIYQLGLDLKGTGLESEFSKRINKED